MTVEFSQAINRCVLVYGITLAWSWTYMPWSLWGFLCSFACFRASRESSSFLIIFRPVSDTGLGAGSNMRCLGSSMSSFGNIGFSIVFSMMGFSVGFEAVLAGDNRVSEGMRGGDIDFLLLFTAFCCSFICSLVGSLSASLVCLGGGPYELDFSLFSFGFLGALRPLFSSPFSIFSAFSPFLGSFGLVYFGIWTMLFFIDD